MATFKQRDSGWWQAVIRRKGYPPQSHSFRLLTDAEAWARQIENEIDRGVFVSRAEAETTSLFTALTRYAREVSRLKKGHDQEKYRIAAWQENKLANRSLASLHPSDFAEYRDERLAAGASPATIRNDLAVISHLMGTAAKEWGIPVVNPIASIRLPRANNARKRRLVEDEEARLLAAFAAAGVAGGGSRANIWIPAAFVVAIETAMRKGELLALRWEHIDLKRRVAHLPETKNGEPRNVPLSSRAVAVLEALPKAIKGQVFMTTASALDQSWRRCLARARWLYEKELGSVDADNPMLLDLTWHDLRHEATSRLAEKLALHELMKVTGHKDTRMLARYYHPKAEDLAKKLG